jgi:hypothetical protein
MGKGKEIDYLLEDRPIPGQKYALISIVGPNYKQDCEIYAVKIRGFASSSSEAKKLTESIMRYDNAFDIYTAPVGLFFPIDIDPSKVKHVEYANKELNNLVKHYTENQVEAQDLFHQRKQEMIKEAIREGKQQEEASKKPEHPVSVLGRVEEYKARIQEMEEKLEALRMDHTSTVEKWESYPEEERKKAEDLLNQNIKNELEKKNDDLDPSEALEYEKLDDESKNNLTQIAVQSFEESQKDTNESLAEIKAGIEKDLDQNQDQDDGIDLQGILLQLDDLKSQIKRIDKELEEFDKETAPSMHKTLEKQKSILVREKESLVKLLNSPVASKATRGMFNKTFGEFNVNLESAHINPSKNYNPDV